ncbi:MAG TPA: hypothetical protein VNK26_08135 [Pyrinomonadaceae bacterium]|nr:hypothetical protein [Pyrinomonadaceae bacterium]
MFGKNLIIKFATSLCAVAVLLVYTSWAAALPSLPSGEITVNGQVSVNGQPAVTGATILSGSTITTGPNSSATISLGKTGRIELLADSTLVLNFSDTSIVGQLSSGKAKFMSASGVATTVATKDATIIGDTGQADSFVVEVECSHTHVDTTAGMVTLREGTSDRAVAAGSSAVAGNMQQTGCKPCLRPNSAPPVGFGFPWWLFLVAGGIVATAILIKDKDRPNDGTVVVSPTR